ncbi:amidohydrolase [Aspergillus sclerotioniger CBS 115572]|uniref:Peptidase M20 domain-containing protein 2 n=1 Tax=Aspergillus sclerotioniger CBS 115572 TaxID=1450535 RepID=A0A317XCW8_9EURO|nr:amidohydrolase [Aspergillus sclerotioniger CBS 115572]PWY95427.1 amidohydrolase [Aspergillus sclerotioniger CBS 115572]
MTVAQTIAYNVPNIEEVKASVDAALKILQTSLRELNREIWSNPETAYQEHRAHDTICGFLENQGFTVTRHAYGLDTSFEAISGSGGRLINFNAEYDALPDIGHACGHNLITTSSMAAFLALSAILKQYGIPGRTQLLGTPAEENGGGKAKLIDVGAYKGVDVSLMAHAGPKELFPGVITDGVGGVLMNARKEIHCEFTGRSAHAGGNPWEGVNALDALVTSYNNVSVLRQQLRPDERIHCAFLDTPKVANVIPAYTKAYWQVRSPTLKGLNRLMAKVRNCIEAGALATGCEAKIIENELYTDVKINDTLCDRYQAHMAKYDRNVLKRHEKVLTGSSDIGNVSYLVPTLHTMFGITSEEGSFPHHPTFAAAAGTDYAHEEAVIVGKSLALIGWEMVTSDELFGVAQKQWRECIAE